jgi:hypothetical protein
VNTKNERTKSNVMNTFVVVFTHFLRKLQAKLLGHFGDRITIQPQCGQGMSNIMFSSCLAIGDAIAAAGKLKSMLRLTEIEHELATETSQESQEHILTKL